MTLFYYGMMIGADVNSKDNAKVLCDSINVCGTREECLGHLMESCKEYFMERWEYSKDEVDRAIYDYEHLDIQVNKVGGWFKRRYTIVVQQVGIM